ncbi:MAG: S26 family signal peptidase [Gluconacetobacter sp.]
MTRRGWFFTTYAAVFGIGAALVAHPAPRLLWNATASVPVGLYRLHPDPTPHVGDLVALRLPAAQASLLATRGYLPLGVPLLKPVVAVAGQSVCRIALRITIDGVAVGDARTVDHRGRSLPAWQGCQRLSGGQIFVMNPAEPRSLDGRYFGPLSVAGVIGRATPLWLPSGTDHVAPVFSPPSIKAP